MKLEEKIERNELRLISLKQKKENIEREIVNLENKIQNQKYALNSQKGKTE